ncbi:MAG: hypothetical protein ACI81R_003006, partial [Bradymonadia bacterium]
GALWWYVAVVLAWMAAMRAGRMATGVGDALAWLGVALVALVLAWLRVARAGYWRGWTFEQPATHTRNASSSECPNAPAAPSPR